MSRKVLFVSLFVLFGTLLGVLLVEAQGPQPGTRAPRALAGTAFTYQGQLKNNGAAVNGMCDFQFGLWDTSTLGAQVGTTQTVSPVSVTNGLFTASIDFGADRFTGDARWLAMAVRCPNGSGSYTAFTSRQALTPAPMAFALPGLYTQQNATSPNIIGGYNGNTVTPGVVGATIGGGGRSEFSQINRVTDIYGTVSGGINNRAGDDTGTTNDKYYATVGGGWGNTASGGYSTVGGGDGNTASGGYSTIGGGSNNTASGGFSTIGGGSNNTASDNWSFAAGRRAKANHSGTFVWGDYSTDADFTSTANNQFLIRARGGVGINGASFVTTTTALQVDKGNILVRGTNNFAVNGDEAILNFGDTNHYIKSVYNSGVRIGTYTQGDVITILQSNGNVGIGNTSPNDRLDVNGIIRVGSLGAAGATSLCRNASNQIATCSSSLRYKSNVANMNLGLDTVAQLRPVTFDWKDSGQSDLGFVAEEVNQVTPLLATRNADGQVEGVKYDRVSAVLVKGMQEQQTQIADLKAQNAALEARVTALEQAMGKTPTTDVWNNGWMIGGLLLAVILVGTRCWGGTR